MYIFQFYREGGERSHANTRLINPALHIVRKNLLQTINDAFISDFNHIGVDGVSLSTATTLQTREREKKKFPRSLLTEFFSLLPLNDCEPSITPERKAGERVGEREKRDERRLNGRSQNYWIERGKSGAIRARLTANAERIYPSLSSFPSLYPRVSSSSPFPRQISSVTPPLLPPPLAPLDPLLIGNHCHAANCQPVVHRIGSGANALSLRYSKSITEHKGRPLNPVQHLHFQHLHSLIASCHTPPNQCSNEYSVE